MRILVKLKYKLELFTRVRSPYIWQTRKRANNTPITGVKKTVAQDFLLRLINIDNYSAFSIFKPSSYLFVLKK
jgi:hypothetical protein